MDNDINFGNSIPSDNDGFIVLKCPTYSEKFMLKVSDVEYKSVIYIQCPKCDFKHDNYLYDDIHDLVNKIVQNYAVDFMNNF